MSLNDQELRNATYRGEFKKIMKELGEDDFWIDNKIITLTDLRRMSFLWETTIHRDLEIVDSREWLPNGRLRLIGIIDF